MSRHLSLAPSHHPASSNPLHTRIAEKKLELQHLAQLRDLSAAVATQLELLESKLATLRDGAEAVAAVVANWHNVLQAINMASLSMVRNTASGTENEKNNSAGNPGEVTKAQTDAAVMSGKSQSIPLPETLVRIPTEHAPTMLAHADGIATGSGGPTIPSGSGE